MTEDEMRTLEPTDGCELVRDQGNSGVFVGDVGKYTGISSRRGRNVLYEVAFGAGTLKVFASSLKRRRHWASPVMCAIRGEK